MEFIWRKIQGEKSPQFTLEQMKQLVSLSDSNERILRAIINSQKDVKEAPKVLVYDDSILQQQECQIFFEQSPDQEILKYQLQMAYRGYKSTYRTGGNGMQSIIDYEQKLQIIQNNVDNKLASNCELHKETFQKGQNLVEEIYSQSISGIQKIKDARDRLANTKKKCLKKQIEIVEKYKAIQRMKYTLEKIKILKATFGPIMAADCDSYQMIPIMKETQNNIYKYKLNELQLTCIEPNYFENKIETLKENVQNGIYTNYLKFDEKSYHSNFRSYFYLEKHYQMPQFVTYIWVLAKKSINTSILYGKQMAKDSDILGQIKTILGEIIDLLLNFHLCNRFHQNYQMQDVEADFEEYLESVRQTYLEMRSLIWEKLQKKLIKYFKANIKSLKDLIIEDFIILYGYICLFIKRAEDFSHTDSQSLCQYLQELYMQYVNEFHRANIKMVCTYLSNELYQRLPLSKDQKLMQQFQQIQGLKFANTQIFSYLSSLRVENPSPNKHQNMNEIINNENEILHFYLYDYQNPFKLPQDDFIMINKCLWNRKIYNMQPNQIGEVVLSSTSIRIFEQLFNYVCLCYYNQDKTIQIQQMIIQLLEVCVINYVIFQLFISFSQLVGQIQQRYLLDNFSKILPFDENKDLEFYNLQYEQFSEQLIVQERYNPLKQFIERINFELSEFRDLEIFQTKDRKSFSEITERAVAVESINYLLEQIKYGFSIVDFEFQTQQFEDIFNLFKEYTYQSFMSSQIKMEPIVQCVTQIKWDIREIHNENQDAYIKRLVSFIIDQREKLKSKGGGVIPLRAQEDIYQQLIKHCLNVLIENFGKVKKVSGVGREQMTLEFTQICKAIDTHFKCQIVPLQFYQKNLNYLRIFNQPNYEDIDSYIDASRVLFKLKIDNHSLTIIIQFDVNMSKLQLTEKIIKKRYLGQILQRLL